MKTILLKPGERPKVVELSDKHDYTDIKKLLEIDSPITCVTRKIGDTYYDIWLDDEGLLKEDKFISAFCVTGDEVLVGSLLITSHDEVSGKTTGLTDEDIKKLTNPKKVYLIDTQDFLSYWQATHPGVKTKIYNAAQYVFTKPEFGEIYIKLKGNFYAYML